MISGKDKDISTIINEHDKIQDLYDAILSFLHTLGSVEAFPHKTQISFGGKGIKTYFAFVWLPQTINNSAPEDSITLTIDLPHQIIDPAVKEAVKIRDGRWTHHIVIEKKSDISSNVREWLRESYEFGKLGVREWRKKNRN